MRNLRALAPLLVLSGAAIAQTDARLEFEVASIKPSAPGASGMLGRALPGGRLNITNMTLKSMIATAWSVQPFQISGGPSWLDSARYDITAKAERTPKQGELQLMLQALLEDRFHLKVHRDTRELPIYALVLAKKDGKLGPALIAAKEGGCTPIDPGKLPSPPEPGKPPKLGCGNMIMNPRSLRAVSIPADKLAMGLSRILGRTVVDKTGLTGSFDISVEWIPDEVQAMQMPPDAPKPLPADVSGPSIFAALQEKLGLKLESQKGPVETLIIDGAERSSEN